DWGRISMGADRNQSIATGDVSMTLPSFSVSPTSITLFRASPETERWYSNATFNVGVITGSRSTTRYADPLKTRPQDQDVARFRASPSFSIHNFTLSASGDLNRTELREFIGQTAEGEDVILAGSARDEASWSARASYRLPLIGTSNLSPRISLNQELLRDTA